jgi:hypothetical protein
LAIKDQVSSENKDAHCEDWNDFKRLKAENTIPEKENLVDFKEPNETLDYPWESSLKWGNTKLLEMVAHFWLIHLKQIFK